MPDDEIPNFCTNTEESIVQAGLTSIAKLNPLTGALVDAYMEHKNNKRWSYVGKFFEDVRQQMEAHEEKIKELYTKTDPDEILHLMFIAIDNVEFEYQESRRTKYAKLFVNSILLGNQISFDEKRFFFQLFNELSEADIDLLGKFNNSRYSIDLETFRKLDLSTGEEIEIGLEEVVPLVVRLESRGLIFEITNNKKIQFWEDSIDTFDSTWRNKMYTLTPIGIKFIIFLNGKQ
jgi:hypothetical protein